MENPLPDKDKPKLNEEAEVLEKVKMVMGLNGRIYYVTAFDSEVLVREIQPGDDQHRCVFRVKADTCLGFSSRGEFFYI